MRVNQTKTIIILCVSVLFGSCMPSRYLSSVAEKDKEGKIIIKWEVPSEISSDSSDLQILMSRADNPSKFTLIKKISLSKRCASIRLPKGSYARPLFILKYKDISSGIVTNRKFQFEKINNFEDIGGHFTQELSQMKWGKLYRSSDISKLSKRDRERLKELKIRTIIDLRPRQEIAHSPIFYPLAQIIEIPLPTLDIDSLLSSDSIINNRGLAFELIKDHYISIVENEKKQISKIFRCLKDKSTYPILIVSQYGKNNMGIVSALIQSYMNIPYYIVEDDYKRICQDFANYKILSIIREKKDLNESEEKLITAFIRCDKSYLRSAFDHILNKYSSIENYVEKELKINAQQKEAIVKNLFY